MSVLNDSEENHKLLKKMPEWIVPKWSRLVVKELDKSGDYPSFNCFAEFVQKEVRIVCNPIASPLLFSIKSDGRLSKGVKSFSTNTQAEHLNNKTSGGLLTSKPKLPCLVCKEDHLGIAKCPVFVNVQVNG